MLKRDIPLSEFNTVKILKQKDETCVSLVVLKTTQKEYVIKAYNKEKVNEKGQVESILAERDIMRLIAGI